jgi:hypothetical protein
MIIERDGLGLSKATTAAAGLLRRRRHRAEK